MSTRGQGQRGPTRGRALTSAVPQATGTWSLPHRTARTPTPQTPDLSGQGDRRLTDGPVPELPPLCAQFYPASPPLILKKPDSQAQERTQDRQRQMRKTLVLFFFFFLNQSSLRTLYFLLSPQAPYYALRFPFLSGIGSFPLLCSASLPLSIVSLTQFVPSAPAHCG